MRGERGAVLLYVLLLVAVMSAAVVTAARTMQVDAAGAYIFRNGLQARSLAVSGLEVARMLLYRDMLDDNARETPSDTFQEEWADFDTVCRGLEDELSTGRIVASLPDTGEKWGIEDEQGKFPVNMLGDSERRQGRVAVQHSSSRGELKHRKVLSRLFSFLLDGLVTEKQLETLPDCLTYGLVDWLDEDDLPSAETASCPKAVAEVESNEICPNRSLEQPGELRRYLSEVGLSEDMVRQVYEGRNGRRGLKDLVTLVKTGGININTAPVEIAAAMAEGVDRRVAFKLASAMDKFRRDPWNKDVLAKADWYRELAVEGASEVSFPGAVSRSRFFSVRVGGVSGSVEGRAFCYLVRNETLNPDSGVNGNVHMFGFALE